MYVQSILSSDTWTMQQTWHIFCHGSTGFFSWWFRIFGRRRVKPSLPQTIRFIALNRHLTPLSPNFPTSRKCPRPFPSRRRGLRIARPNFNRQCSCLAICICRPCEYIIRSSRGHCRRKNCVCQRMNLKSCYQGCKCSPCYDIVLQLGFRFQPSPFNTAGGRPIAARW